MSTIAPIFGHYVPLDWLQVQIGKYASTGVALAMFFIKVILIRYLLMFSLNDYKYRLLLATGVCSMRRAAGGVIRCSRIWQVLFCEIKQATSAADLCRVSTPSTARTRSPTCTSPLLQIIVRILRLFLPCPWTKCCNKKRKTENQLPATEH